MTQTQTPAAATSFVPAELSDEVEAILQQTFDRIALVPIFGLRGTRGLEDPQTDVSVIDFAIERDEQGQPAGAIRASVSGFLRDPATDTTFDVSSDFDLSLDGEIGDWTISFHQADDIVLGLAGHGDPVAALG